MVLEKLGWIKSLKPEIKKAIQKEREIAQRYIDDVRANWSVEGANSLPIFYKRLDSIRYLEDLLENNIGRFAWYLENCPMDSEHYMTIVRIQNRLNL